MPAKQNIYGWDGTQWVKVLVNAAGKLIIDPTEILEDTPTDGEVGKAPTSNWAHDHEADPDAHHTSPGEGHVLILPHNYSAIGAGTWVVGIDVGQLLNGYFYNSSNANLDELDFLVYMAAGTYTLRILGQKNTNLAIVDIDIDGVEVASYNLYAASITKNAINSTTGIVVATSGLKTITFRVDGRHASSTAWYGVLGSMAFWRTA